MGRPLIRLIRTKKPIQHGDARAAQWIELIGRRLSPGESMDIPIDVFARHWRHIEHFKSQGVITIQRLGEEKVHVEDHQRLARGGITREASSSERTGDVSDSGGQASSFAELHPDF